MKAVVITAPGGPEVLKLQEVEDPAIGDDEVLIKVVATALNRADTIQRVGGYPPPKGASPYLGLECSGIVEQVGSNVSRWKIGDQVCALLSGGGYAEKVAVPVGQILPIPPGISLKDAASFPEVACTVWSTVFMLSKLKAGETFLAVLYEAILIELGANVNAFCPGRNGGTPLHYAAKRGLEHTVELLILHGANALLLNDNYQTPLDIARAKGFTKVVRMIEGHICLFSGWLRDLYGPSILELLAPQFLSRRVWTVVVPSGARNLQKPFKLELAIYDRLQDAQPQ